MTRGVLRGFIMFGALARAQNAALIRPMPQPGSRTSDDTAGQKRSQFSGLSPVGAALSSNPESLSQLVEFIATDGNALCRGSCDSRNVFTVPFLLELLQKLKIENGTAVGDGLSVGLGEGAGMVVR